MRFWQWGLCWASSLEFRSSSLDWGTESVNTCPCSAPCETFLCNGCTFRLEQRLAETDSVLHDLELAVPRLTLTATYGERMGGSKALHAPAPVNIEALDAKVALHRFLADTALRLAMATDTPFTNRSPQGLASYLLSNINALRAMDWVGGVYPELSVRMLKCEAVTLKTEHKVFAGTCAECSTDLYAVKGRDKARCRTCGETYEVVAWRAHAATAKEYHVGTPAELSRALTSPAWGIEVTADQIRKWATRLIQQPDGTMKPRLERANPETDENGSPIKPRYRLKDVLDLNAKRKPIDGTAA